MVIRSLIFLIVLVSCNYEKSNTHQYENSVSKPNSKNIILENESSHKYLDSLNWKMPREIKIPNTLIESLENIDRVLVIDFTGDGVDDYLCYTKLATENGYTIMENWIDSSFQILRKKEIYLEYDYKWFIDLDNDHIPEIIKAQGESEGIDYGIYKLDLSNENDKVLLYFNPIIEYGDNFYWGYPWELKDIVCKENQLKIALNHSIIRDGEITRPKWQKELPAIIFEGKTNSEVNNLKEIRVFQIEDLKNIEFMTVENLKKSVIIN